MYINVNILQSKDLSLRDLILLQLCKQQKFENLSKFITEEFDTQELTNLERKGYTELIKGTAKQSKIDRLRITKKGQAILEDVETPEILDEDLTIFEWLKNTYLSSGRELGNQKKTKLYIALFRTHSGIEKNKLAYLCNSFINDPEQFDWSRRLEFLLFKPATNYEKFNIDGSRLYQYYLKNEQMFLTKFEKL